MAQITFTNTGGITATGALSGSAVYSNGTQCLTGISAANVTGALGYTPVSPNDVATTTKAGIVSTTAQSFGGLKTFDGLKTTNQIIIQTTANDEYNEGIRINKSSNNWAGLIIGGNANTTKGAPGTNGGWFVAQNTSNQLMINNVDSTTGNASIWINTDKTVNVNNKVVSPSYYIGTSGAYMTYNSTLESIDFNFA